MFSITDRIKFIEAENGGRFPRCHCLLIDDNTRVLIESNCRTEMVDKLTRDSIQIIINSHFHKDHTGYNNNFPNAQIWAHPLDAPAIRSAEIFCNNYGVREFGNDQLYQLFFEHLNYKPSPVHREIEDGELLDFGHVRLRVIHTPGHTPGHCCFFEEQIGLLFSGDIDLSGFGPWYGHACSNVDDLIISIQKCIDLKPEIVVSCHKGIITDDINGRLKRYMNTVFEKEAKITEALKIPLTLDQLTDRQITYGNSMKLDDFQRLWEKQGIYHHLQRLIRLNEVSQNGDIYYLTGKS